MNESTFKEMIEREKISMNLFSIHQLKEDRLCLRKSHYKWEVFYFERGREFDLKEFYTESEAYDYLYSKVRALHDCHLKYGVEI